MILSIEGREGFLYRLVNFLASECKKHNLFDDVEVLLSRDVKGEHSIGYKRNICNEYSTSVYSMFIDDDDMLVDGALSHIIHKLKTETPDCIALEGIYTENGSNPKKFIHSMKYGEYSEQGNVYLRPPNHLNPIKTSIAKQFKFPEINHGEDTEWAMQIAKSKLIKTESNIGFPYYLYDYITNK